MGDGSFKVVYGSRSTIVQYHFVNIDTYLNKKLADNKPFISHLLAQLNLTTPASQEYDLKHIQSALEFCERTGICVIKLTEGSGGVGVTTGVATEKSLIQASIAASAKLRRPTLVIEAQVPGDSYRLLYLGGELIDVLERRRPTVAPDGKKTVRALIEEENLLRQRSKSSRALNHLSMDLDCRLYHDSIGMTLSNIPLEGSQRLAVKNTCNENCCLDNSTVFGAVHASYRTIGRKLYSVFGGNLIGLDIITLDIIVPLNESGGAINEVNIPPSLHYHDLIDNPQEKRNVGVLILEYILNSSHLSCF